MKTRIYATPAIKGLNRWFVIYLFGCFRICDSPREKVPPRGFLTIIYDVIKI